MADNGKHMREAKCKFTWYKVTQILLDTVKTQQNGFNKQQCVPETSDARFLTLVLPSSTAQPVQLTLPSSPRLCLLDRTWIHNTSDGEFPGIMVSTRITLWKTSFLQQDEWRHRQKSTDVGCFLDSYDIMAVVWTLSHDATCFYNVSSALLFVFIYLTMSLLLKMVNNEVRLTKWIAVLHRTKEKQ